MLQTCDDFQDQCKPQTCNFLGSGDLCEGCFGSGSACCSSVTQCQTCQAFAPELFDDPPTVQLSCGNALDETDLFVADNNEACQEAAAILTEASTEFNGPSGDDAQAFECFGSVVVVESAFCSASAGQLNSMVESFVGVDGSIVGGFGGCEVTSSKYTMLQLSRLN